jgi:hypothetical protein
LGANSSDHGKRTSGVTADADADSVGAGSNQIMWTAAAVGTLKQALLARVKWREGWEHRALDRVFLSLPSDCRPIQPPLHLRVPDSDSSRVKGKQKGKKGGVALNATAAALACSIEGL